MALETRGALRRALSGRTPPHSASRCLVPANKWREEKVRNYCKTPQSHNERQQLSLPCRVRHSGLTASPGGIGGYPVHDRTA